MYQYIANFSDSTCKPERINSKFWGEGKWVNFIKPLLPFIDFENRTFIEIGCNAGLFLLMAKQVGFKRIIGIEAENKSFKEAVKVTKGCNNIKLLQKIIGKYHSLKYEVTPNELNFKDIPIADLTLLANIHYWVEESALINYINNLANKSLFCIVIGIGERANTPSRPELKSVRGYFNKSWKKVKIISAIDHRGDSCPRDMYSILFKSKKLFELPMQKTLKAICDIHPEAKKFFNAFSKLIYNVLSIKNYNSYQSQYFDYLVNKRGHNLNPLNCMAAKFHIDEKVKLILNIYKEGIKNAIGFPMVLDTRLKASKIDGYHRLAMIDYLGCNTIICKQLS